MCHLSCSVQGNILHAFHFSSFEAYYFIPLYGMIGSSISLVAMNHQNVENNRYGNIYTRWVEIVQNPTFYPLAWAKEMCSTKNEMSTHWHMPIVKCISLGDSLFCPFRLFFFYSHTKCMDNSHSLSIRV